MDTTTPRYCGNCNNELTKKNQAKYCSRSCVGQANKNVPPPPSLPEAERTFQCIGCQKKVVLDRNAKRSKYCSLQCQHDTRKLYNYNNALKGVEYPSDRSAKSSLLYVRGRQCEICSTTEWCGKPIDLVLDHIDGNSDNRHLANYRLICNNCDAQTDTFKARN